MKKDLVEELLSQGDKVENTTIAAALEDFKKEQSEKARKNILSNLREVQGMLDRSVNELREYRKLEKKAKERVQLINEAKDQFLKDADFNAFMKKVLS